MSHIRMGHGTHRNECVVLHIWMSQQLQDTAQQVIQRSQKLALRHDSFINAKWLDHICAFMYVTWCIHVYQATRSYIRHDVFMYVTCIAFRAACCVLRLRVKIYIDHKWDKQHIYIHLYMQPEHIYICYLSHLHSCKSYMNSGPDKEGMKQTINLQHTIIWK